MASGSFNIETFSWYRSLPLSNDTKAYSTATMFAVGPSSFLEPYSYYQYQSTTGFTDTSTLSVQFSNYVCTSLQSTTSFLGKMYVSTIPLMKWIGASNEVNYFPFPNSVGTIYNFRNTYNDSNQPYPNPCIMSTLWLGEGLTNLINSKQFNVYVDSQYSLYVSTPFDTVTWISTVGVFNELGEAGQNVGRTSITRTGNETYMQVYNKQVFTPQPGGLVPEIPLNTQNFHLELYFNSNSASSNIAPQYDVFIPGENNFTFTLVPVLSTIAL